MSGRVRPRPTAATTALVAATLLRLGSSAPLAHAAGLRTGCDAGRPAVAYHPGAGALSPQPAARPIPCLEVVSRRTSESATVAVSRTGRVFYAPLVANSYPAPLDDRGPALLAASDDGGSRWSQLAPGSPDHILDVPPWMSRDPDTSRIWFATVLPDLCGAEISWSDDDGKSWQTNPIVGCPGMGSMRILEGPPPVGGARPTGYPHVVYYCANLSDFSTSNLWCYRSLDGGSSFAFVGSFPDPPPTPGCNTEHPARPGVVGRDGVLYFPIVECGDLSVATSRDEGTTWQRTHVANSSVQDLYITSMAADRVGDLYLAWIAGPATSGSTPSVPGAPNPTAEGILGQGVPMLAISRDHGQSWSAPVELAPPGVSGARHVAVVAEASGDVAVSFLASADGSANLDGYLTETSDALAANPLWWAASVNDPATPLINATDSETFGDRLFFLTDTFAPTGEPWAAFHCAKTSGCPGERIGVVGRLESPANSPLAPRSARPVRSVSRCRIRRGRGHARPCRRHQARHLQRHRRGRRR